MKYNKFILIIVFFIIFVNISVFCQKADFNALINTLPIIKMPIIINGFNNLVIYDSTINHIDKYNDIITKGRGYIKSDGNYRKATGTYSTKTYLLNHHYLENGLTKYYLVKDSNVIQFVARTDMMSNFIQVLARIKDIESGSAYFEYQILSFDKEGNHLSSIMVFQQIDDSYTIDYIKEKEPPSVTSQFNTDGSIDITCDEGYDEIYIQHVKLNNEGIFYIDKLLKIEK